MEKKNVYIHIELDEENQLKLETNLHPLLMLRLMSEVQVQTIDNLSQLQEEKEEDEKPVN